MVSDDIRGAGPATFREALRRARETAGMTQQELAERSGLSAKAIGMLERGERLHPQPHTVRQLAEGLGLAGPERVAFIAAGAARQRAPSPSKAGIAPVVKPSISGSAETPAGHDASHMSSGRRLPVPLTSFIGRRDEVAGIRELLRQARLVTLSGVGGTGKTRLAIQVAAESQASFSDGVYFINLAPIDDPDLVPLSIENALGARTAQGDTAPERVVSWLADRSLLLVLDNFEQVLEAAPFVSHMLREAPGVRALVTSRVLLRLYGEHEFRIAPLKLPDDRDGHDNTAQSEAVQLFVQAARAARAGFDPDPSSLETIAAICRQLDGLPLAIELAAARCRYFTPEALLPRLTGRLDVEGGTRQDLPARQQTLRQAFDWSYALLPASEQALFAQLGIFAGGFEPEMVEIVCPPRPDAGEAWSSALAELQALHESGLLESRQMPDGELRFEMLQTVREYAQARLAERGETEEIRQRHALGYLRLAEEAKPHLIRVEQSHWMDRLERERDNFRLALQWAEDHEEYPLMLRLTAALWRCWDTHLHLDEEHGWLSKSLTLAPATDCDDPEIIQARLESIFGLARITLSQGKATIARDLLLEGLSAATARDDIGWMSGMLTQLSHIAFTYCEYDEARSYHEQALKLRRRIGDPRVIGISLRGLGRVAYAMGDYEAARGYGEDAMRLLDASAAPFEINTALPELARTYASLNDLARARELYNECLDHCRQEANAHLAAHVLPRLAPLALTLGEHEHALSFYQTSLEVFRQIDHRRMITICLEGIGVLLAAIDEVAPAIRLLGAASRQREAIGIPIQRPNRVSFEHACEQGRDYLGEIAFETIWHAGHSLTLEQAVNEALSTTLP